MSDMPNNSEALKFEPPQEGNKPPMHFDEVVEDGSSALRLEPDASEEKGRDAEIGEIKKSISDRSENVLPFTKTPEGALVTNYPSAEAIHRPGVARPSGNQGREASGGDRTGGRKKGIGVRIMAGVMAGVAGAGLGYGILKDKINSFFGGGVDPNSLPPTYSAGASGEMPSQSIDPITPSAEVTTTPEATENVETQSPSSETIATSTPELDEFGFTEERREILIKQFQDFLNEEGEFTEEKKSEMAIGSQSGLEFTELGLSSGEPLIEGYFFDYIEKDGSLILLMGFDGKDSKSFVTPIQIPLYYIKDGSDAKFWFFKHTDNTIYSEANVIKVISEGDVSGLFEYLDKLRGKVIVVQPSLNIVSGSMDDYTGVKADYIKEYNSKVGLSQKLVFSVATNGISVDGNFESDGYDSYEILKLENLNSLSDIELSKIPMINPLIFYY